MQALLTQQWPTAITQDPGCANKNFRIAASAHQNIEKQGKIFRQSSLLRLWKERHVVVTADSFMFWYTSPSDQVPEDVIALKKATGVRRDDGFGRPNSFIVTTKGAVLPFSAASEEEMEQWLRVIGKAIVRATTTEWDETSDRLAEQQGE